MPGDLSSCAQQDSAAGHLRRSVRTLSPGHTSIHAPLHSDPHTCRRSTSSFLPLSGFQAVASPRRASSSCARIKQVREYAERLQSCQCKGSESDRQHVRSAGRQRPAHPGNPTALAPAAAAHSWSAGPAHQRWAPPAWRCPPPLPPPWQRPPAPPAWPAPLPGPAWPAPLRSPRRQRPPGRPRPRRCGWPGPRRPPDRWRCARGGRRRARGCRCGGRTAHKRGPTAEERRGWGVGRGVGLGWQVREGSGSWVDRLRAGPLGKVQHPIRTNAAA